MAESEQNKTEEATPFKLKRAREKGMVARGVDLGFLSCFAAFALFALAAGGQLIAGLTLAMRRILASAGGASDPLRAMEIWRLAFPDIFAKIALLGATVLVIVVFVEIIQVRGLHFAPTALKPDFSRINPAKGLKRLFSTRMLKETLKNLLKFTAYSLAALLVARHTFTESAPVVSDAWRLTAAFKEAAFNLLAVFGLIALAFAAIDQVLARGEFSKQMRMTKSELKREFREREGEPRLKAKRKQLHAEFAKQTRNLGSLNGADMLIVNPEHYAVALGYDARRMEAPKVLAKGHNHFALLLKRRAAELSLPIFESPELARALYKASDRGQAINGDAYRPVADLYRKLPKFQRQDLANAAP